MQSKNWIIIGLVVLAAWGWISSASNANRAGKAEEIAALNKAHADTLAKRYNEETGKFEYSKQSYAATVGQLTDFLADKDAELARLAKGGAKAGVVTRTELKFDTVVINRVDTVHGVGEVRTAEVENPHYSAEIVSYPDRTRLNMKSIRDSVTYRIDKDYRLTAIHSNPYLNVVQMESFYVKPKPAPRRNWKYIVGGLIGGAIVYGVTR